MADFNSTYNINEEVIFRPMYRHQKEMGIADEDMEGRIIAVRFTESKVFYDILSPYWGKVFDGIDSVKVSKQSDK